MKKRIGIMGGTFDPIHIGHLILAEKAYEELALDEVWFMPSGNPPHKQNREGRASDQQRVEMVRKSIADNPHFRLSTEEMHPDGYTYTYETLERLHKKYPDQTYYFMVAWTALLAVFVAGAVAAVVAAVLVVVAAVAVLRSEEHTSELQSH